MKQQFTPFFRLHRMLRDSINCYWCCLVSVCLLLSISLPSLVFAQNKIWDKTIGGDNSDNLQIVQRTKDGGYILGGYSTSGKSNDKTQDNYTNEGGYPSADYWIVKLKADGTKEWDKTLGGKGDDYLYAVQQTQDGGYILGGTSISYASGNKSQDNFGGTDYWIVKLDARGNKLWDKTYGGISDDRLYSFQQTTDGGYILGGASNSGISGNKSQANKGSSDYWILKINAKGDKEWDKTFGGTKNDEFAFLQQTTDGGYILGGTSNSGISGDKSQANKGSSHTHDYWLVKITANGSKMWDRAYGGNASDVFKSVLQTPDGGYIIGGNSNSGKNGDKSEANKSKKPQLGDIAHDFWILKLNANGNKAWDKTIGSDGEENFAALQQTKDGGYILGGSSANNIGGDKTENNKGYGSDYWIVKLKKDGSVAWDRTIGGNNTDELQSIAQTSDGNFILGGSSSSNKSNDKSEDNKGPVSNSGYYSTDYWLVKIDNSGTNLSQYITLEPVPAKHVGDAPFTLAAAASSGLPVTLKAISGPVKIKDNVITITGEGKVTIKAIQAGNATYKAAPEVTRTFNIYGPTMVKKQWDKTIGAGESDKFSALISTSDGGYLLGGSSLSGKSGDKSESNRGTTDIYQGRTHDFWVVKTDADGKKIWDKTWGGREDDKLTALVATPDGGYLLGGSSASDKSGDKSENNLGMREEYGHKYTTDYWVVKIDAAGNKLWDKTYGGNKADNLTGIILTTDGGFLLGGSSTSGSSGNKTENNKGVPDINGYLTYDYWVLKINSTGNKLWDYTYGGQNSDNLAALSITGDGGFLLGGSSASGTSGDKSQSTRGFEDYWVIRLNADGQKIWDKTFGGIKDTAINPWCEEGDCRYNFGRSTLSALTATPDGGFLLGGSSSAEKGAEKSEGNLSTNYYGDDEYLRDYWVVKVDGQGNKLWDKVYGGINKYLGSHSVEYYYTGDSQLKAILATPGGGYLLAGFSNSDKGRDKNEDSRQQYEKEFYDQQRYDYWVVKIDEDGQKKWDQTVGGLRNDFLATILSAGESSYVLGGSSVSEIGGDKSEINKGSVDDFGEETTDYWLVKLKDETPNLATWDMRYGGADTDNLTTTIKTSEGGYLSGGYTNSPYSGDKTQNSQGKNDFWIVKSDKNGKKLWDKRYGGSGDDYLNRIIQTQDGGFLLAGSSLSGNSGDKSQASQGDRDFWIVKTDAQGNKQWDKRFGGSGYDELKKVIQLSTGEYILAGYSNSPVSGNKTQTSLGGSDFWLVKISKTGIPLWDKRYGGTLDETLGGLVSTSDGGLLLAGTSASGQTGDKSESSRGGNDFWLVRTDKNGNLLWEKTYGGSGQDEVYSVGRAGKNEFFISGQSDSPAGADKTRGSQGGKDFWFIKVTSTGAKIWDKRFGGTKDEELRAGIQTSDGGYILAGKSFSDKSGNKRQDSQGSSDYWIVKTDADGMYQWSRTLGGSGAEELRTVLQTEDGGLLLAGKSASGVSGDRTQPSQGGTDYWLVKLAPETLPIVAEREATEAEEQHAITHSLVAYPNPFQGKVTVNFTLPKTQLVTVKIYDNQGREISTLFQGEVQAKQTNQVEWQATNQAAGLYFLQLQTKAMAQSYKLLLRP